MRTCVGLSAVIVALALVGSTVLELSGQQAEQGRVTEGLIVLYEFDEGQGDVVNDKSGVGEPLNLLINDTNGVSWLEGGGIEISGDRVAIRTEEAATKIIEAAQATHQLTIEAVLTPQDTAHKGPARIVSLSRDSGVRNFTLGQSETQYILRLRTSETNEQGTPEAKTDADVLKAERQHVVATYGAEWVYIYVNGELKGEAARSGDFSTWASEYRFLLANEDTLDRQWRGKIELVAIYDHALSPAEVKQNFQALTE